MRAKSSKQRCPALCLSRSNLIFLYFINKDIIGELMEVRLREMIGN